MRRRRGMRRSCFSYLLIFFMIILVSVCFGQVLGSFYLANINKNIPPAILTGNPKMKALRLNKFAYYSVLAGSFPEQQQALEVGNSLARQGLPPVISGEAPFSVLVGFTNNAEGLAVLAASLEVAGKKAEVQKAEANAVSYKFAAGDTFAEGHIAPFIGNISLCLQKGLFLFSGVNTDNEGFTQLKPKMLALALELRDLAHKGVSLSAQAQATSSGDPLSILATRCEKWAASLEELEKKGRDLDLLISQQQALALLEDYGRFLKSTN